MTLLLAVSLIAVVVIVVAYVVAIYRFGFQREFFLVPPVENIDELTDDEIAIVSEQRIRELGCTYCGSTLNHPAEGVCPTYEAMLADELPVRVVVPRKARVS